MSRRNPAAPSADLPAAAGGVAGAMQDILKNAALMQQAAGYTPEDRTLDEFREEVEFHMQKVAGVAPAVAVGRAIASGGSPMLPLVENPTETNFRLVQVSIYVPGPVMAIDAADKEDWTEKGLPASPRLWGSMKPPAALDFAAALGRPPHLFPSWKPSRINSSRVFIEHKQSATLTFDAMDLRPRAIVELDPVYFFAMRPELAGETLEATWEATSTSADGVATGILPIRVSEVPQTIHELLEDQESDQG